MHSSEILDYFSLKKVFKVIGRGENRYRNLCASTVLGDEGLERFGGKISRYSCPRSSQSRRVQTMDDHKVPGDSRSFGSKWSRRKASVECHASAASSGIIFNIIVEFMVLYKNYLIYVSRRLSSKGTKRPCPVTQLL